MSYKQMCFKSTPATQTLLNGLMEGRILCGKMKSKFDQLVLLKKNNNNKHVKYIDDDFIT